MHAAALGLPRHLADERRLSKLLPTMGDTAALTQQRSVTWRRVVSTAMLLPTSASAQSFADPAGSGPIVSAVHWLEGTLLGTIATVLAVIAVASVGLLMLTGRINWRYGATVILGCFILFGAASIVGGIQSTAGLGQ